MAFTDQTFSIEQRLSQQLHCFSELTEVLTLRVLELEDRLSVLERSEALKGRDKNDFDKHILDASQEKVMYLQNLLAVKNNNEANSAESLDQNDLDSLDINSDETNFNRDSDASINYEKPREDCPEQLITDIETEYIDDEQEPLMSA